MFEQMLNLVKGQVAKTVGGMDGIPAGKQAAVVSTTTSSLMDGLKNFATPDKLSSLLGGTGRAGGEQAAGGLTSNIVSDLTSKVGLKPAMAQGIAGSVVPSVMSLFSKNVSDPSKPGFNLQSMIGALTGGAGGILGGGAQAGSTGGGILGGLMSKIGSFFGGK